jgi:hypothetical protein
MTHNGNMTLKKRDTHIDLELDNELKLAVKIN